MVVMTMPKLLFARPPVDAVEERKIRKLAAARHAPADWIRRAQIIALSWDGMRVPAIAKTLGCGQKAVRYRLARFAADGLDGLGDRPGVGRKPRISQAQRSQVIALVASTPPGRLVRTDGGELVAADAAGPAVWTLDALTAAARAAGIDIARSQVRRILLAEGVRWRRPRAWATSADPEFVPKERGSWATTPTRRRTPRSSPPTSSAR
jgi:transposase